MADKELSIVIKAKNMAKDTLDKVKLQNEKLAETFVNVAKKAAIAGAAIGALAINEARKFEKSISNINTLFDDNGESAEAMAKGIKEILKSSPVSPDDLGSAAYQIVSAGISDTSEALRVLEKSSQLAVAGLATTEEAVNISTSAINAFGLEGKKAERAFDVLQLTVKSGKTNIAELAQSFGNVAGIASEAGISFEELQAATAALTTTGQKASVAQTQLRSAILALQAPNSVMAEIIQDMGFESGEAALKQLGLVETMIKMKEAGYDNVEVLKQAFGSVEALGAMVALTGEQNGAYTQTLEAMSDATGVLDTAYQKQRQTFDANYQILKNNLSIVLISLGEKIIPLLNSSIEALIEKSKAIYQWFADNKEIAIGLSVAIGVMLIPALTSLVVHIFTVVIPAFAAMAVAAAPWLIGGLIIGGIVAGVLLLIKHWDEFKVFMAAAWESLKGSASSGLEFITNAIVGFGEKISHVWTTIWTELDNFLAITALNIRRKFFEMINSVLGGLNSLIRQMNKLPGISIGKVGLIGTDNIEQEIDRINQLGSGVSGPLQKFARGGITDRPAIFGDAGPEAAVPLPDGRRIPVDLRGGGRPNVTVNIYGGVYRDVKEFVGEIKREIANDLSLQFVRT